MKNEIMYGLGGLAVGFLIAKTMPKKETSSFDGVRLERKRRLPEGYQRFAQPKSCKCGNDTGEIVFNNTTGSLNCMNPSGKICGRDGFA